MVRVIAGTAGGSKLKTLDTDRTKPTLDRVKEPMFSILAGFIPGANVLDLFAGSGALGLEALSRGAAFCRFCDCNPQAAQVVRDNLRHTRLDARASVLAADWNTALKQLKERGEKLDLVLLDPPYAENLYVQVLESLQKYGIIAPECVIMCEHSRKTELPEEAGVFRVFRRKGYGTVGLTFYMAGMPDDPEEGL